MTRPDLVSQQILIDQAIELAKSIPGSNIRQFNNFFNDKKLPDGAIPSGDGVLLDLIRDGIVRVDLKFLVEHAALAGIDERESWEITREGKDWEAISRRGGVRRAASFSSYRVCQMYVEQRAFEKSMQYLAEYSPGCAEVASAADFFALLSVPVPATPKS